MSRVLVLTAIALAGVLVVAAFLPAATTEGQAPPDTLDGEDASPSDDEPLVQVRFDPEADEPPWLARVRKLHLEVTSACIYPRYVSSRQRTAWRRELDELYTKTRPLVRTPEAEQLWFRFLWFVSEAHLALGDPLYPGSPIRYRALMEAAAALIDTLDITTRADTPIATLRVLATSAEETLGQLSAVPPYGVDVADRDPLALRAKLETRLTAVRSWLDGR